MSMTTGRYLPASCEGEPTADLEPLQHFFQMTVTSRLLGVERADECRMLDVEQRFATTRHIVTHSATTDHETRLSQFVCGQLVRYSEASGRSLGGATGVVLGKRGVTGMLHETSANQRKEPQPRNHPSKGTKRDHKQTTFVCVLLLFSW